MDYVTNHWGIKHWMITDLPTKDWINQFDNYQQHKEQHNRYTCCKIDKKLA
jgi:hypothetical protein